MDAIKKRVIKNRLITEIDGQKAVVADLEKTTQPISPDRAIGRISRMDAIQNKSVNEAAMTNARERLAQLEHALETIDQPDFGVCELCGEAINPLRLLEVPEATTCVKCRPA